MGNKGWKKVKLSDIGRIVTGKTPPTDQNEYYGGDYPFITPTDISDNSIFVISPARYLTDKAKIKFNSNKLPKNAICYTCIASIGKMALTLEESFTNQQINSLIVDHDNYDYRFVFYKLKNKAEEIYVMAGGAATPIINKSVFSEIEVNLPPLPTQQKIASVLSAYDELIENNTRRIKLLEELAQTIYTEWFVHFRFPGHEDVKMVESGTEFGEIPEGWEVKTVEEMIERRSSGKKYSNKTAKETGLVPILDQGRSGIIGYHNNEPGVFANTEEPIIVFANHTCYQRLIQYPFSAIQNVLPFMPSEKNKRDIYWLHCATKDLIEFNDYKGHWPEFICKTFVVPTGKTAEEFGETVKPIVKYVYELELLNENLKKTRDLLLPKLVTGEVEVK